MPNASPVASRHEQVSRQLWDDLAAGRYGQEGRLPSEAELARRFSVSRPTVARALQSLVEAGLVERRAGSGTFAKSGGVKEHTAPATRVLALLMPDLRNTEIFQVIGGEIAGLARVHNYGLIWGGSGEPELDADSCPQHAEELCHQFIERRVSGVFFAPFELVPESDEINRRLAAMLREAGIPVILIDRDFVAYPFRSAFDLVGIDNMAGGTSLPNICSRSVAAGSILSPILALDRVSMRASPACVKLSRVRVSNRTQTGFTSVRWITNPLFTVSLPDVGRTHLSVRTITPPLCYCVRCIRTTSVCPKMSELSASMM